MKPIIVTIFMTFSAVSTVFAVTPSTVERGSQSSQSEGKLAEEMSHWLQMSHPKNPSLVINPSAATQTERAFLKNLNNNIKRDATGSGNGGDPIASHFFNEAVTGFLSKFTFNQPPEFRHKLMKVLSQVKVIKVAFNLCDNAYTDCGKDESLLSKSYPERKLILVNSMKYQETAKGPRSTEAVNRFWETLSGERVDDVDLSANQVYWLIEKLAQEEEH